MGRARTVAGRSATPWLDRPRTVFDLLNFNVSEFYNVSGALVTRICEGELGLRREEWQFVAMLAALGPLSPSQLASHTTIDRAQASRTLRALTDKGLLTRRSVPSDGRRAVVDLSDEGRSLYERAFPRIAEVQLAVLGALSADEVRVLSQCLPKLLQSALSVYQTELVGAKADRRRGGSRVSWTGKR